MPGELLGRFAAEQGRSLPRPAAELYHCSAEDLSDFLSFLDKICSYVGTQADLAEVAERFSRESRRENILYAETILNPTHWPQFTVSQIIAAVTEGFDRGQAAGGADCRFTLSLSRTQTAEEAYDACPFYGIEYDYRNKEVYSGGFCRQEGRENHERQKGIAFR